MIKFCDKRYMLAYLVYKRPRTFQYVAKVPIKFAVMLLYRWGSQENRSTARVKY